MLIGVRLQLFIDHHRATNSLETDERHSRLILIIAQQNALNGSPKEKVRIPFIKCISVVTISPYYTFSCQYTTATLFIFGLTQPI